MKTTGTEYYTSKIVGKALHDYKMLSKDDRILMCVSGTDSLALLDILNERLKFIPIKYKIIAAHVNLNNKNARVIENYLKKKGIKCHIVKLDLKDGRKPGINKTPCFWCSWKRREMLFKLANRLKCKKVVFGHHLDDIIETYLMNILFNGEVSAMPAKLKMFKGKFHIIRPFVYLEKHLIEKYAKEKNIPPMPYACPYGKKTRRSFVRNLISQLKKASPDIKKNLFKSMRNIKKAYLP
ncbi:MAG: hypothetical protein JW946_03555 [Candidatus Omnitrophica bacterium]|nr:hypothetical protein [Candidatus Omnitrophota bacterium]